MTSILGILVGAVLSAILSTIPATAPAMDELHDYVGCTIGYVYALATTGDAVPCAAPSVTP
jgi:hypothetical protein